MKYIVTKTKTAESYGVIRFNHLVSSKGEILLNEMELNCNTKLEGSFDERVTAISGKVMTDAEARDYTIKNEFEICSRQQ